MWWPCNTRGRHGATAGCYKLMSLVNSFTQKETGRWLNDLRKWWRNVVPKPVDPYWSFFQWVLDVYCGGIYHMKINNLTTIRRMPVLKMCDDRFRRFQPRSVEQHQLASTLPLLPGWVGKIQLGRENGWLERKTEELHPEVFYIVKPDHLCQAGAMDVNLFCGGTKSMKELPELVNQGRGIFLTTELERSALRCQGLDLWFHCCLGVVGECYRPVYGLKTQLGGLRQASDDSRKKNEVCFFVCKFPILTPNALHSKDMSMTECWIITVNARMSIQTEFLSQKICESENLQATVVQRYLSRHRV